MKIRQDENNLLRYYFVEFGCITCESVQYNDDPNESKCLIGYVWIGGVLVETPSTHIV